MPWSALANAATSAANKTVDVVEGQITSKQAYNRQKKLMALQNQYNVENAEADYQRAMQAWELENSYNTPAQQRARLEAANLNPALMYEGGGASNTAGSLESKTTSGAGLGSAPMARPTGSILGDFETMARIKNIDAQTENTEGATGLQKFQADVMMTQALLNESSSLDAQSRSALNTFNLNFLEDTRAFNLADAELSLHTNKVALDSLLEDVVSKRNKNAIFPDERILLRQQIHHMSDAIVLQQAKIEAERAGINLTYQQIQQAVQTVKNLRADEALKYFDLNTTRPALSSMFNSQSMRNISEHNLLEKQIDYFDVDKVNTYINSLLKITTEIIGVGKFGKTSPK